MKRGGICRFFFIFALFSVSASLLANDHYRVVNGPEDFYYGHISYVDPTESGPEIVVLREGGTRGLAGVLNTPIAPGDTVRTPAGRRCEIQFDSGTIVRLDHDSELKIETILAKSLSSNKSLSNLVLNRGRMYVMYKEYGGREMFQVLTLRTAVKLKHSTVAVISAGSDGPTETQVNAGRADVLFGSTEKKTDSRAVTRGKRLIIGFDDQPQFIPAFDGGAFTLWNEGLNGRFLELHEGQTAIPKPIQKYPRAVQYFAEKYGNLYGEWIWDGMLGYVWRPAINDISNAGYNGIQYTFFGWDSGRAWRPYAYGQWTAVGGQMFWVPMEPWGWVPYHLGLWHWSKKLGWVWIPGSAFSPAWADWAFFFGYQTGGIGMGWLCLNGWSPINVYQWMAAAQYDNDLYTWFQENASRSRRSGYPKRNLLYGATREGQLLLNKNNSPIPLKIFKNIAAAVKSRDPRILEEINDAQSRSLILAGGDLSDAAKPPVILPIDDVEKFARLAGFEFGGGGPAAAFRVQPHTFDTGSAASPAVVEDAKPGEGRLGQAADPSRPIADAISKASRNERQAVRFRDWNPDLRVARALGVRIEYVSGRNEIYCPKLNLSSADRTSGLSSPRMSSSGMTGLSSSGAMNSALGGFRGSSSSSSGSSSSVGSTSSSATHDTNRGSSGSSGSGAVRK